MSNRRMIGMVLGACALGVGLAALAGAGSTVTTLVSGGGPAKSDCYTEIAVQGISASDVTKNKKITCVDGDPCDAGPCGDNNCVVKVDVCWNQTNLSGCTPPASLDSIIVKKLTATIPANLNGASCTGAFVDVAVSTKKNGKKPGKFNFLVKGKAPKGTKPRTDADAVQVICVPRTTACSPSAAFLD